ncbi:NDP-sugar epimerase [Fadolivirus algeromassiliense]|jgi:FlaA1/EpsC-like NDP-sugar epimerase|uniref:NDP-sugar epimerase n=1 Tax=Fadolivirus FV1/VV64 TaxID=3070911 RepID=A0A7D3USH8_9VIRU|nr:NDP-sugar epimerase [Fadolivirus algeromassiliense]QKF93570.1 NDP-sugar epimerase [Fadolivirus FV1/VV64]
MIINKKILIFGGSGSLGNALIKRYLTDNIIINYSRDECKHWKMGLKYKSENLKFIIGDIRDYNRVENSIIRENPHIIIIAAALKHIDRCEYAVNECYMTNFMGPMNVLNTVEKNRDRISNLETVVFISTDKATSPINSYGICKALSEKSVVEKSLYIKTVKFVSVRYGNILNSNGSIIQILNKQGLDPDVKNFTLTHENMSRFVMTLEQSVDLIEHAILYGESGDIVIPKIVSMKVKHLMELFSEKYNKPIIIGKLRPGEKMLESLINETQAMSMSKDQNYYYLKPPYKNICNVDNAMDYNSSMNPLSKEELKEYLIKLNLL